MMSHNRWREIGRSAGIATLVWMLSCGGSDASPAQSALSSQGTEEPVCDYESDARPEERGYVYPSLQDDCEFIFDERLYDYDVVFTNVLWRDWEPSPGDYRRHLLDRHAEKLTAAGKKRKLAIRFQAIDKGCTQERPRWMGDRWTRTTTAECECGKDGAWSPDWTRDEVQTRHASALKALGAWVDDHREDVAWVELGSFGLWGEWHHHGCADIGIAPARGADKTRADMARLVDAYACAFPRVPLTVSYDALKRDGGSGADDPVAARLRSERIGLYYDSIGVDDADFQAHATAQAGSLFAGPFGGEFRGDEGKEGAFTILNDAPDGAWSATLRLLSDHGFLFVRQGGANAVSAKQSATHLTELGRKRFAKLNEILRRNNEKPDLRSRLEWLTEPRSCLEWKRKRE